MAVYNNFTNFAPAVQISGRHKAEGRRDNSKTSETSGKVRKLRIGRRHKAKGTIAKQARPAGKLREQKIEIKRLED